MRLIVGLSGGKDSTAMALRLREIEPEHEYTYLCTPTGDELPAMLDHWSHLEVLLGQKIERVTNGTLSGWIEHFKALPNWRQRWCTRLLKIEPTIAFVTRMQPATLCVGLRADEELREGIVSRDIPCRFPLREWGWGLPEVLAYLRKREVTIPQRTDCARCYGQRLSEWKRLLVEHPAVYADAERQEAEVGATFRSPGRDTWPAGLAALRSEFATDRKVRGEGRDVCRVCTL